MMTLEDYLRPDPSLRPPLPTPRLWKPPARTRATLLPAVRSRGSSRGSIMRSGREYVFHSGLEHTVGYVLSTRPDTADLWDQPPAVVYVDDAGISCRHTFDWLVTRTDGVKVAIAVKPAARVEKSGIRRVLDLCSMQIPTSFANRLLLMTEKDITAAEKHNASLIHSVSRAPFEDDDRVVDALIAHLKGDVTIGTLVEASGLDGWGFGAVVRAIASRRLLMTGAGRIDYATVVRRAPDAVG